MIVRGHQWLTSEPDPKKQSWATSVMIPYSRTAYRLTVLVPNRLTKNLHNSRWLRRALGNENAHIIDNWEGSEKWLVYAGMIPPRWIVKVEKMAEGNEPVDGAMVGRVLAIDFDGTLCKEKWPEIGAPRGDIIRKVKLCQGQGCKLILNTCREGKLLDDAVQWCRAHGIEFDAVNENLPERIAQYGSDCRKISADEYWDDRAVRI